MLAFYRFVGRPGFTRACWPRDLIRACPLTRAARPCLVRNPSCPGQITRPLFEARKVTQHAAHHRPDRHRLNQLPGAASRTRLAHPPPARQPKRHHHHRPLTHQRRAPRRTDHQPPRRTRRSPLTGHRSIDMSRIQWESCSVAPRKSIMTTTPSAVQPQATLALGASPNSAAATPASTSAAGSCASPAPTSRATSLPSARTAARTRGPRPGRWRPGSGPCRLQR